MTARRGRTTTLASLALLAGVVLAPIAAAVEAGDEGPERQPWFLTFYGGQLLDERARDIFFRARFRDFRSSFAVGVGLGREMTRIGDALRIEIEANALQHFGRQSQQEGSIAAIARWTRFPWDPLIDTSFAVGEGLSYATRRPRLDNGGDTQRLLNYIVVEVELDPMPDSAWSVVGRVHHRSGVFGLFGTRGGSNLVLGGLRFRPQP